MQKLTLYLADKFVSRFAFLRRRLQKTRGASDWLAYLKLKARLLDDGTTLTELSAAANHSAPALKPQFEALVATMMNNAGAYDDAGASALRAAGTETAELYRIEYLVLAASCFIASDRFSAAEKAAAEALSLFARRGILRHLQSSMYFYANYFLYAVAEQRGDVNGALEYLRRATTTRTNGKNCGDVGFNMGRLNFSLGNYELAYYYLRRALKCVDAPPAARELLGRVEQILGTRGSRT